MRKKWTWAMKFLGYAAATYGTLWLLLRPLVGVLVTQEWEDPIENVVYILSIAIGLMVAWLINRPKKSINIKIRETDSEVTVEVGDIFEGGGLKFIPVNEYFDCKIGRNVSRKSLHGQFITKIMGGDANEWRRVVKKGLQERKIKPTKKNVKRNSGERNRYEIGTTVRIETADPGQEYMLVVLCRTNIKTLKAEATLGDLCTCLEAVCKEARNYSEGKRVDIPVIGSGFASLGLPAQRILDILMLFVIHRSQKEEIAKHIRIVMSEDLLKRLDLHETERTWKQ